MVENGNEMTEMGGGTVENGVEMMEHRIGVEHGRSSNVGLMEAVLDVTGAILDEPPGMKASPMVNGGAIGLVAETPIFSSSAISSSASPAFPMSSTSSSSMFHIMSPSSSSTLPLMSTTSTHQSILESLTSDVQPILSTSTLISCPNVDSFSTVTSVSSSPSLLPTSHSPSMTTFLSTYETPPPQLSHHSTPPTPVSSPIATSSPSSFSMPSPAIKEPMNQSSVSKGLPEKTTSSLKFPHAVISLNEDDFPTEILEPVIPHSEVNEHCQAVQAIINENPAFNPRTNETPAFSPLANEKPGLSRPITAQDLWNSEQPNHPPATGSINLTEKKTIPKEPEFDFAAEDWPIKSQHLANQSKPSIGPPAKRVQKRERKPQKNRQKKIKIVKSLELNSWSIDDASVDNVEDELDMLNEGHVLREIEEDEIMNDAEEEELLEHEKKIREGFGGHAATVNVVVVDNEKDKVVRPCFVKIFRLEDSVN